MTVYSQKTKPLREDIFQRLKWSLSLTAAAMAVLFVALLESGVH